VSRHLSRRIVVFGGWGVVLVGLAAATARLFVFPRADQPQAADAIVVLGGPGPRLAKGIALARAGYAPLLVVSMGRPPGNDACQRLSPAASVQVVCFRPSPFTTQGEARFVRQLAAERHLRTVIVVPGTAQTTRARLRFSRCYSGAVLVDPVAPGGFFSCAYSVVYEWGALIKALTTQRSC
jgi:uncharacterized SAM-binding protein YcdF (DUF218 family)